MHIADPMPIVTIRGVKTLIMIGVRIMAGTHCVAVMHGLDITVMDSRSRHVQLAISVDQQV